jgi:hypothetical protein
LAQDEEGFESFEVTALAEREPARLRRRWICSGGGNSTTGGGSSGAEARETGVGDGMELLSELLAYNEFQLAAGFVGKFPRLIVFF